MASEAWQAASCSSPKAERMERGSFCCLCGIVETIDHIFYCCPFGKFVWCCVRCFRVGRVSPSTTDLMENWLTNKLGQYKSLALFIFAGFMWAIWKKRNKMAIERTFPNSPTEVVLYSLSFLQKWEVFLNDEERNYYAHQRPKWLIGQLHGSVANVGVGADWKERTGRANP